MGKEIENKKIELFVDNGIDKYRATDKIKIIDVLSIFFDNKGFFVLEEENHKVIGYLDMSDIEEIREIMKKVSEDTKILNLSFKEYRQKYKIKLKTELINADERVIDVIKKIEKEMQNYFPVVDDGVLIGRISKRIIKEKLEELY
jgi:CBS domain-containing protein